MASQERNLRKRPTKRLNSPYRRKQTMKIFCVWIQWKWFLLFYLLALQTGPCCPKCLGERPPQKNFKSHKCLGEAREGAEAVEQMERSGSASVQPFAPLLIITWSKFEPPNTSSHNASTLFCSSLETKNPQMHVRQFPLISVDFRQSLHCLHCLERGSASINKINFQTKIRATVSKSFFLNFLFGRVLPRTVFQGHDSNLFFKFNAICPKLLHYSVSGQLLLGAVT